MSKIESLQEWFSEVAARVGLAGASLSVAHGDTLETAIYGLARVPSNIPVTTDTVFQIGSITKVYTAVLVLQLAEAGRIDIDQPYRQYVPEFRPQDVASADRITVRQLLLHTSGLHGDFFPDTGPNDDCVARFVDACSDVVQVTPPGDVFSYCNTGWVLLGRLVEKILGTIWDDAMASRIFKPVGLNQSATRPQDILMYPSCIGHLPVGQTDWRTIESGWAMPRSIAPAGSSLAATTADVVRFAQQFSSARRSVLLNPGSVKTMLTPMVKQPGSLEGNLRGLAWMHFPYEGGVVVGHDGGNKAQGGRLRLAPEHDFAIALLVNGGRSMTCMDEIVDALLEHRVGLRPIKAKCTPEPGGDLKHYEGLYTDGSQSMQVRTNGEGLEVALDQPNVLGNTPRLVYSGFMAPWGGDRFMGDLSNAESGRSLALGMAFSQSGEKGATYLHFGGRVLSRRG